MITPVTNLSRRGRKQPDGRQKTQADIDAFLSAAGGWKDLVDIEQLKRDIAESRARSNRLPLNPRFITI